MTTLSPRETLDRAIHSLLDDVLVMGSMVEEAIIESVDALKRRDLETSRRIYHDDLKVNQKHYEIENTCLTLIATQQPMARDLRLLAAVLEVNTELERIGDYAKGIARINVKLGDQPLVKPLIDIPRMAEKAANMLHRALGAFAERDTETARTLPDEDEEIDGLYNQVYRELLTYMIADPSTIDRATYLLWVAHNLERSADRVTNICERTLFVVTGEIKEMDRTDDELSPIS
ncbi:MAG: phosphate transport system regulatory protein PhoU [Chloroflexi bacterium RBG_16_58_14]|nr:MAG: phosphate transport system regulatory protein PhoU [Chloroflexi bacterium RBG_16_58_14]